MDTNKRLLIGLAAIVTGVGTLMVPGASDQVSMLLRDRSYASALEIAEKSYASGDSSPQIMRALYELRSYFGDVEGTTKAIETLAAKQPIDVAIDLRLADHYYATQNMHAYIATLETIAAQDITHPVVQTLLGYYGYRGNVDSEIRLLGRLVEEDHPAPSIVGRLGMLLARRGELTKATELLARFDQASGPSARKERLTLFQLLLDSGESKRAYERAVVWNGNWRDPKITRDLAERLRATGQFSLASRLAALVENDEPASQVELVVEKTRLRGQSKSTHNTLTMRRTCSTARELCHVVPIPDLFGLATPNR